MGNLSLIGFNSFLLNDIQRLSNDRREVEWQSEVNKRLGIPWNNDHARISNYRFDALLTVRWILSEKMNNMKTCDDIIQICYQQQPDCFLSCQQTYKHFIASEDEHVNLILPVSRYQN